jgi:hypothetical protein
LVQVSLPMGRERHDLLWPPTSGHFWFYYRNKTRLFWAYSNQAADERWIMEGPLRLKRQRKYVAVVKIRQLYVCDS